MSSLTVRFSDKPISLPEKKGSHPLVPVVGICRHDGKEFYASRIPGDDRLTLCLPTDKGVILRTDSQIVLPGQYSFDELKGAVVEEGKTRAVETRADLTMTKAPRSIFEGGEEAGYVIDFLDVNIYGMASTWVEDRDKERMVPGAFKSTISRFKKNPVMLIDHYNSVRNIVGSYSSLTEGTEGLIIEGKLSNSPDTRGVRFLVAEKHLRAMSIGGFFRYHETDRSLIVQVELLEISLVAVPSNPEALFSVRALDLTTAKKAFQIFTA